MPTDSKIPYDEQERRAHVIYEAKIRPKMTPADADKYVIIDIITGDYEIGENEGDAVAAAAGASPRRGYAQHLPSSIAVGARAQPPPPLQDRGKSLTIRRHKMHGC